MMEFRMEKASAEDADVIADVIRRVWEQTEKKEWFVPDDAEYERRILQSGRGIAYKAVEMGSGAVAGVFVAVFPGEEENNLGWDIGFDREQALKAAHMDSVAILPEYRGHRLQYRLMMEAEQALRSMGYEYLLCTVHPENRFSRDNILRQGYEVVMTKEKYGGYLRDILLKNLAGTDTEGAERR